MEVKGMRRRSVRHAPLDMLARRHRFLYRTRCNAHALACIRPPSLPLSASRISFPLARVCVSVSSLSFGRCPPVCGGLVAHARLCSSIFTRVMRSAYPHPRPSPLSWLSRARFPVAEGSLCVWCCRGTRSRMLLFPSLCSFAHGKGKAMGACVCRCDCASVSPRDLGAC